MKQKADSTTSYMSTDIYRIYDFNPMLAKTEQKEQDRIDAIDALVMTGEFQYRADSGTLSGMSLDKMVINAVCSYYPNPADMDNRKTAFTLFRDVLLKIINYYRMKVFYDPAISTPDDMNDSKYKPITKIAPYFVVETLFGFYDIYNATYSEADILEGAFVCQSKDEEQDPLGKFRSLDQIVALFKSELLTPEVSVKNLASSIKFDSRVIIHFTNPIIEDMNEYLAEVIPCNNGVYIKTEYEKTKRLLSYRECLKEPYNLFVPFYLAANYLGVDNPPPVMSDGFIPSDWVKQMYGEEEGSEREEQFFAVILAIARAFDMANYQEGIFFEDNGEGNTGKSTTTTLIRSIVGSGHYEDIDLSQMSKGDFLLQNLAKLGKFLIISDENNPEDFMKDITNYKKLCTGDPIYLNIKNDAPVGRVFRGRIVQCINGIIKMAEINGATERRFYPMLYKTHVDTGDGRGGITRNKLIKSKWMKDQRVIDWFLTEAINRNICPLPKTQEMLKLRDEIEEHNSSVLRFIKKYLPNMMQNWVEVENLYQAYRAVVLSEGGKPCNLDNFKADAVRALKKTDSGWTYNHNEDDPSVFVNKNMGQFHIPMGAWSLNYLGMNDDVVYTNLKNLASDDHKRDPGHAAAKNALRTIYSMNKPGTKGKNTFYRTPDAEAAVLIRIARQLINEAARDAEDNLPIEVVLEILNAKQRYEWPDGNNPFNCSPKKAGARLVDVDFTVRPSQGVYPDKEKVWDHVIKRLKKLAKEVDVLQIDA